MQTEDSAGNSAANPMNPVNVGHIVCQYYSCVTIIITRTSCTSHSLTHSYTSTQKTVVTKKIPMPVMLRKPDSELNSSNCYLPQQKIAFFRFQGYEVQA